MLRRYFYTLTFLLITAQTGAGADKSGDIDGQTWTRAESPYHIIGNINVIDLTIEPGVEIYFDGRHQFQITGNLKAEGLPGDSIYFKSDPGNPFGGYAGIHFTNAASATDLNYLSLRDALDFGIKFENDSATISNSSIRNISANGLEIDGTNVSIHKSTISNNTGNGIQISSAGHGNIYNSKITGNTNYGISSNSGSTELKNSIISHNTQGGIVLFSSSDTLQFENSTIAENTAGPAIGSFGGIINGINSILYSNGSSVSAVGGSVSINFSNIEGTYPGEENIDQNPQFVDTRDFMLTTGSPCINTGDPDSQYYDVCFPPSHPGDRNDMGAYGGPKACHWYDPMVASPEILNFKTVTVNKLSMLPVVIRNFRGTELLLTEINISGTDSINFNFEEATSSIAPFDSLQLNIGFLPDQARAFSANLIITGAGFSQQIPLQGQGANPQMFIPQVQLNFPEIKVNQSTEQTLIVGNLGQGTLYIDSISTKNRNVFKADTTFPLALKIDDDPNPLPIRILFQPDNNKTYADTLFIYSNDPNDSVRTIGLSGTGLAPILTPSQSSINFGTILTYTDTINGFTIENTGNDTLLINDIQIVNESFNFISSISDSSLLPGEISDLIEIAFSPVDTGYSSGHVNISSNDPFNPSVIIPLSGTSVKPVISVAPENFIYGDVILGESQMNTIWIYNTGDTTLKVDSVNIDQTSNVFSANNPVFPLLIPADSYNDDYILSYSPANQVSDSMLLTIFSNDSDQTEIKFTAIGRGILPLLSTHSDTIDFSDVSIGDVKSDTLFLSNSGTGNLIIDSLIISGINGKLFEMANFSFPDTIPENSSAHKYTIYFSPDSIGEKNSSLLIFSNDPNNNTDTLHLSGSGTKPEIEVLPPDINFNTVFIGDTDSADLTIYNRGKGPLVLNGFYFSGDDSLNFSYTDIAIQDTIPGEDSSIVKLIFTPDSTSEGEKSAKFIIESNDHENSPSQINLHGVALIPVKISIMPREMFFDTIFVNQDSVSQLVIRNGGPKTLIIDSLLLTSDSKANFLIEDFGESLTIPPSDSVSIAVTFRPQVTGDIIDTLLITSNDPLNNKLTVPLNGYAVEDTTQVTFVFNTSLDTLEFNNGSYRVEIEITKNGPPLDDVTLYLRKGGENKFFNLPLAFETGNIWSEVIPESLITSRGLEYYVQALYGSGAAVDPDSGWKYPSTSIINNIHGEFSYNTMPNKYQMISLPVVSENQTLADLFLDDLGAYDNTKYRLFDWDHNYSSFKEMTSMGDSLPPGKALWLITSDGKQLTYTNCQSVPCESFYEIPLRIGWNMFGTPFDFDINAADINKSELAGSMIYEYTPAGWIQRNDSTLVPHRGYAAKANFATSLLIPNIENGQSMIKTKNPEDSDQWHIQLIASRGKMKDIDNYAGTKSNATNNPDPVDYPEPPEIGEFVQLYFEQDGEIMAGDFRQANEDGYIFEFIIKSNFPGTSAIEIITDNIPPHYQWQVISPQTGIKYTENILTTSAYEHRYKLVVGNLEFVADFAADYKELPTSYNLSQNYPNPFNPETKIKFTLPKATSLSMEIFDITGRRIKTLSQNEIYEAGYYEVTWDGRNNDHMDVSSGIYFLYLRSAAYNKAIKMILQR